MSTFNLGKVAYRQRFAWNSATADYEKLDVVTYNGSSYEVILASGNVPAGTLPTNTTYFGVLAAKGDTGPAGAAGGVGPTGPAGTAGTNGTALTTPWTATSFASGAQVNYLGKDYTANAAAISTDVPGTSTKWDERLYSYRDKDNSIIANSVLEPVTGLTTGLYIADGTFSANSSYRSWVFTLGNKIDAVFSLVQFTNQYIVFFDSSMVVISTLKRTVSAVNLSLRSIAPAGTWYVGFSWQTANPITITSKLYADNSSIATSFAGGVQKAGSAIDVKALADDRIPLAPALEGVGKFGIATGIPDSTTGLRYAYFDYTQFSDLYLTASTNLNNSYLYIFDVNKVMISRYSIGAPYAAADLSLKAFFGDVPPNTAFFGINGATADTWSVYKKTEWDTINKIEAEIQTPLDANFLNMEKVIAFSDDFSTQKADWTNTSGWTFDTTNKTLTPSATGDFTTNYIQLSRPITSAIKRHRMNVVLFSDTVMNIMFKGGNGVSMYQIDIPNRLLKMFAVNTDTTSINTAVVVAQTTIDIPFTSGNSYLIDVSKSNYYFRLSIHNLDTQAVNTCFLAGWTGGEQQRNIAFSLAAGTPFKITSLSIVLPTNFRTLFVGDSITNGATLETSLGSFLSKHATLIGKRLGTYNISAMSGESGSLSAIDRFDIEYSFMKPKLMIMCIGTNGGFNATVRDTMISKASALGIRLIFNYIPTISANTTNTIIDGAPAINRGARFDKATSVGGIVASGKDGTLFSDGIHPNKAGSLKMYTRFFMDVADL